tara:strand:+ start:127 stop:1437 length:1311 start_codon:yes stop_codon:yes gene_type:complete
MTTTVTAEDNAPKVLISQTGRKGDPGTNGTNGDGFNQVRKSLLDNPLCHLFKTNKLVETSAPTSTDADVTWNRSTSATYVDRYGTVKTAAVNTPREEKEGFLIEGASTNIARYSEQFDNAAWLKIGGLTVTADATISPSGLSTADLLSGSVGAVYTDQYIPTAGTGETITASVFLKQVDTLTTSVDTFFIGGTTKPNYFLFEWSTLSVLYGEGSVTAVGNGWVRVDTQNVDNNSGNTNFILRLSPSSATATTAGSVYAWGAQAELSPFASSYIPTVASSVTRTADRVSLVGFNNSALLSSANTISLTSSVIGLNSIFNQNIFTADANSTVNRLMSYWSGSSTNVINYISGINYDIPIVNKNIEYNLVSVFTGSEAVRYVDGNLVNSTTATYTGPDTAVIIYIGCDSAGNFNLFGHIKDFRFYDFALNANEAEYLSA